jgi:ABC-2 type transport system permease protein
VGPARAIAWRALGDARIRDGCFALFFLLFAYANPVGYRHTYPTLAERVRFALSFGTNKAVELFYGAPHDLLTVGGFTAWRFGGFTAIVAAVWGVLAAVRALRAEEDAGRQELVLAGVVSRRSAYLAVLGALAVTTTLLALAIFLGLVAGRLPVEGSALLALATISPAAVFVGVGALASQLAPTRRGALGLATAVLAGCFLLRVVADVGSGLRAVDWVTPFGWSEEVRAFAGPRPAVLLLPAAATALLCAAAGAIAVRRDIGSGLLRAHDTAEPNLRWLSSPTALAFRLSRGSLFTWLGGIGLFAVVVGTLSTSFTTANISSNLQQQLQKVSGATLTTPAGALGFYFLLFVLAISLYACGQLATVRREEADQQLETLFALPVGRRRWLVERLALAAAGAAALGVVAALLSWAGSTSQNAGVPLSRLVEAGLNCLPTALLFLGIATLAFALAPRASAGLAYGLVALAFVWELFGSLLGAPHWTLNLTPFQHVGLVPAEAFRGVAAAVMLAIAAASAGLGVYVFGRRDLIGA